MTNHVSEGRIWSGLESVHTAGHFIIKQLLKLSEDTKHFTLLWIGNCLSANQGRGKMWTNQMGPLLASGLASDGLMLNLGSCLLRLCLPLTENETKMDKVNILTNHSSALSTNHIAGDTKLYWQDHCCH